jgi:hypothetical protein
MRMFTTALLETPDSLEDPSNNINGTILGIALSPPDVIGVRLRFLAGLVLPGSPDISF